MAPRSPWLIVNPFLRTILRLRQCEHHIRSSQALSDKHLERKHNPGCIGYLEKLTDIRALLEESHDEWLAEHRHLLPCSLEENDLPPQPHTHVRRCGKLVLTGTGTQ